MKLAYTLSGGQAMLKPLPIYGSGTSLVVDAGVMKGATAGTNDGFFIVGAPAYAGFAGVITVAHTNTVAGADTKEDGTAYTRRKVIINPDAVWRAEHTDPVTAGIAVASTSGATAGATITITSLEASIGSGWLWADYDGVAGGNGEFQWITNNNGGGSCTVKSAQSTAWTSATKVAKLERLGAILTDCDTTCVKIKNPVGAPTGKVIVLENWIQQKPNARLETLDPTKHSGLVVDNSFAKAFSDIIFQNHCFANIGAS